MWRCQTSIGLHKPIWMNLEWMIHRISQPPSYPSNTFGKSGLTKVLLGGLLCLLLQLLKQRTSRLTHKKSHPTYWHIGWRPSMPLPNAPSLPPEAKTTWIMLQHVEITMKSVIFNVNIKKKKHCNWGGSCLLQLRASLDPATKLAQISRSWDHYKSIPWLKTTAKKDLEGSRSWILNVCKLSFSSLGWLIHMLDIRYQFKTHKRDIAKSA